MEFLDGLWNAIKDTDPVSVFGIVISTSLAIYFYLKSKRRRKVFFTRSDSIVLDKISDDEVSDIEVRVEGKEVDILVVSKIVIWNGGNMVINPEDIAPSDPIAINMGDQTKVFAISIIDSNSAINFSATEVETPARETVIRLRFDYLDPGEAIGIKIIHDSYYSPSVNGSIKGFGHIKNMTPYDRMISQSVVEKVAGWISVDPRIPLLISAMILIVVGLFQPFKTFLFILAIALFAIGFSFLLGRNRIPKKIEELLRKG